MKKLMMCHISAIVYCVLFSFNLQSTVYWHDTSVFNVNDDNVILDGPCITLPTVPVTIHAENRNIHVCLTDDVIVYANDGTDSILNFVAEEDRTIYVHVTDRLDFKHSSKNNHKLTINQLGLGTTQFIVQAE